MKMPLAFPALITMMMLLTASCTESNPGDSEEPQAANTGEVAADSTAENLSISAPATYLCEILNEDYFWAFEYPTVGDLDAAREDFAAYRGDWELMFDAREVAPLGGIYSHHISYITLSLLVSEGWDGEDINVDNPLELELVEWVESSQLYAEDAFGSAESLLLGLPSDDTPQRYTEAMLGEQTSRANGLGICIGLAFQ